MRCGVLVLVALIAPAMAGLTGDIPTSALTTVQISGTGACSVDQSQLRVFKAPDGEEHSVLLKFDLAAMLVPRYSPDVVVLELDTDTSVSNQVLIGRIKATVVKNEWEPATACSVPEAVPALEFPARYISGLAGSNFTLNLESVVDELLASNITTLSVHLTADPAATSVDVTFLADSTARLDYHLAETTVDPELIAPEDVFNVGQEYDVFFKMPLTLQNGTESVSLDSLPADAITVQVNEGNLDGKVVESVVSEIERTGLAAKFGIHVAPTASGVLRIGVLLFGNPVTGSPIAVSVAAGEVSPAHCTSEATVEGFFPTSRPLPTVGEETCFRARIRDSFDNPVDGTGKVSLVFENTQNKYNSSMSTVSHGYHEFCFVPTSVDAVSISLVFNEEALFGFPIETQTVPGKFDHSQLVSSSDSVNFEAGTLFEFRFTTRDLSGHKTVANMSIINPYIEGPDSIHVNVNPAAGDEWNATLKLSGTTTVAGNYTLFVDYMEKTASLPFTIQASSADISACAIEAIPEFVAGETQQILVKCADRYANPVSTGGLTLNLIAAKSDSSTELELALEDLQDGSYKGDVVISSALDVSISIGDVDPNNSSRFLNVKGAPFDAVVAPAAFSLANSGFVGEVASPLSVVAGENPRLVLVERDEFGNTRLTPDANVEISAVLSQVSTGHRVNVTMATDKANHTLVVTDWLHEAGAYELAVTANGEALTTLTIEVTPAMPNPTASQITIPSTTLVVGEPVSLELLIKDRFGNIVTDEVQTSNFKVEAVHEGLPSTPCLLQLNAPGSVLATFTPSTVGPLYIMASLFSVPLAGSPLAVEVGPGEAFGPYSYGIGNGLHSAVAGEKQYFLIRVRDTGNNDITVGGGDVSAHLTRHEDSLSDSTSTVNVEIADNEDGTYSASYNTTEAGDYSVFIVVHGYDVANSPYSLKVFPNNIGPLSVLDTSPLADSVVAGTPFHLEFTAFDRFGNQRVVGGDDVSFQFTHTDNSTTLAVVEDHANGTYTVAGYLTRAGEYKIEIISEGEALVPHSPELVFSVLHGPASPEYASIEGRGMHSAVAGEQATVYLRMRDEFYNEAVAGVDVIVTNFTAFNIPSRAEVTPVEISIEDVGNGTYILTYTPSIAGEYQLQVQLEHNGSMIDVQYSPSIVTVEAGRAGSSNSYVTSQATSVRAGGIIHAVLHGMDAMNNTCKAGGAEVTVTLEPGVAGETFNATVIDQNNGLYLLKIIPFAAGVFEVTPLIGGEVVAHTMSIDVRPGATEPQKSIAHVESLVELEAGTDNDFEIETRDRYGNPTSGTDGNIEIYMDCNDTRVIGTFNDKEGHLRPTRAGACNISVLFNGEHMAPSPFTTKVIGSWTSPLHTKASGQGILEAQAGKVSSFIVVPLDHFGNPSTKGPVNVEVTDPNDFLLSISYADWFDAYNISYIPTVTGSHQVHIAVGVDEHQSKIPGSPFSVLVRPGPTSAKMTEVMGAGITEARVGHLNEFIIVARDALGNLRAISSDKIEIQARNSDDVLRMIDFHVNDVGMGMYKVAYTAPSIETTLKFSLLINNEYIGEKNYTIQVVAEPSVFECPDNCNGHGVCHDQTGLCTCANGWIGSDCSIPHLVCPLNCSNHGSCDTLTGACLCDKPFTGDFCECFNNTCAKPNITSPAVHKGPLCSRDCSGHGECVAEDTCVCDVGFAGRGCELKTEYRISGMESGFLAVYEISTGRMFAARTVTSDDSMCSGVQLLEGARMDLYDTPFVRRQRNAVHTHVGDNRLLELDPVTGASALLAFRTDEMIANSKFTSMTDHVVESMTSLMESELTYVGQNRLMVSSERDSEIWIIDRQNEELLVDDVTSYSWPESVTGHYAYFGHNLIGRYTPQGHYDMLSYNRGSNDFDSEVSFSGSLSNIGSLNANTSLVLLPTSGDVWLAINPFTTDYRAFFCPVNEDGFTGCTFLNKGNIIKGFECPTIEPDAECGDLTASDCIKSDRCGYCGQTETCVAGTLDGPLGASCTSKWIYESTGFVKEYSYMGRNLVFDHEEASGKYTVWNLDRDRRSAMCPALEEAAASGFFAATKNHQLVFSGPDMIDFDPLTGVYKIGSCNAVDTVSECSLKCDTWASGQWPELKFRRLVILSESPSLLLDYSPRSGDYRVWEMSSRADHETGVKILRDPRFVGQNDVLRDAEITALSLDHIIVHHPISSSTHFLRLGAQMDLVSELPPIKREPQIASVQGSPKLVQMRYAALGPNSLLEYTDEGSWKLLLCDLFPSSDDVFGGRGSVACHPSSAGLPTPPDCSSQLDEDSCTAFPVCGWCESTQRCYVGTMGGICSKHQPNCPISDWRYNGPDEVHEDDVALEAECALLDHCRTCVGHEKCGWVPSKQVCVGGSPSGPNNSTLSEGLDHDWSFSYCTGVDSCENLHSCSDCAQRSYCGWCPSTNTCMTGTSKRPVFDTCPGSSVGEDGAAVGFYYDRCN